MSNFQIGDVVVLRKPALEKYPMVDKNAVFRVITTTTKNGTLQTETINARRKSEIGYVWWFWEYDVKRATKKQIPKEPNDA